MSRYSDEFDYPQDKDRWARASKRRRRDRGPNPIVLFFDLILLPFRLVWGLANLIFNLVGTLISVVIGVLLIIVGVLLTITVFGAPAGIPMILFGIIMVLRGIF